MNPFERAFRRLDSVQQRHGPLAVAFGVVKKFGDDNAGTMVSALAHAGFGTVFPLLLFLVTVSGMVVGGSSTLRSDVLHSAASQFPIVGTDLQRNISALHRNSVAGLTVGLVGLLWGSIGLAEQGIFTMEQVWNLPGPQRPNYPKRLGRGMAFLATLGVGTLTTTFFSAVAATIHGALWQRVAAVIVTLAVSCGQYVLAFRILTPKAVPWRKLVPGALVAGVGWTVLQELGTLVVGHYLRNDSAVYGLFAIVIGLYAWIYFIAELSVYAAEVNVVLARRLWPRAIVQPPLTAADRRSMAAQAHQNQRRPEQHVTVTFDGEAQTEERFLAETVRKADGKADGVPEPQPEPEPQPQPEPDAER